MFGIREFLESVYMFDGEAHMLSMLPDSVSRWIFQKTQKPRANTSDIGSYIVEKIIDWDGCCLAPEILTLVKTGCIVRVAVRDTKTREESMIYFRIMNVGTDGTVWGKATDIYCKKGTISFNEFMPPGRLHAFNLNNIAEIPIMWQPRAVRRKMHDGFRRNDSCVTGFGAIDRARNPLSILSRE